MTDSDTAKFPAHRPTRTKIVATIGPSSESEEMLQKLISAGVDVFRINMAHGDTKAAQTLLDRIRLVSARSGQPVAVLADLAGPKMRLGEIPNGCFDCKTGETIRFVRGTQTAESDAFTTTYEPLIDDLSVGNRVLLADGTVTLEVTKKEKDQVFCRIVQGGVVRSRQGVNLPGVDLSIKTLQPVDIQNAIWATQSGIDFLGLSFVRSPDDIHELRSILEETAETLVGQREWEKLSDGERRLRYPNIIAKIEKPETLDCLDAVVEAADGVMVARGDLGVEANIARIAVIQKEIIKTCRRFIRPVIVATQMLESMTSEIMPTRAEATDVANAILDGADACMLSGESAIGKYPVEAVEMMHRIAEETESLLRERSSEEEFLEAEMIQQTFDRQDLPESVKISVAVCDTAGQLADTIDASMIFVATKTGRTALNLSKMRNFVMTVGTSSCEATLRRLCLYWGVIPVGGIPIVPQKTLPTLVRLAKEAGYLDTGETVVLTAGIGTASDDRNAIYVHIVE